MINEYHGVTSIVYGKHHMNCHVNYNSQHIFYCRLMYTVIIVIIIIVSISDIIIIVVLLLLVVLFIDEEMIIIVMYGCYYLHGL